MERRVGYSSFWNGENGPEVHWHSKPYAFEDGRLLPSHRLLRLDAKVLGSDSTAVVEEIHDDEIAHYAKDEIESRNFRGVYIEHANLLGSKLGRRGYIFQPKDGDDLLANKVVDINGVPGREVDLNREFYLPRGLKTWEDVFNSANEWTMPFYAMLREFSYIKSWVFIHRDLEFGESEGGYFYYSTYDARNDENFDLVAKLTKNLRQSANAHNLNLFTGFPDRDDKRVNYWAYDGFIYQPVVRMSGRRARKDTALEQCIIRLGKELKLIDAETTFTIEIQGKLSEFREKEVTNIFVGDLIYPFSKAKGFWK